jgi:hypothetical protein
MNKIDFEDNGELEEFYLSMIAEEVDVEGAKTHSHEDAWK